MCLLLRFGGHIYYRKGDANSLNLVIDLLEKAELTNLIHHIIQISKIRNISPVFEERYPQKKIN